SKGLIRWMRKITTVLNQVTFHGNKSRTCLGTLICTRIILNQSDLFNSTLTKFLYLDRGEALEIGFYVHIRGFISTVSRRESLEGSILKFQHRTRTLFPPMLAISTH